MRTTLAIADEAKKPTSFYGFDPLPPRGGLVSNELIDKLREKIPGDVGGRTMYRVQVEFNADVFATLTRSPEEVAREIRLAAAVIWYAQGRVSQGRAAELAGVSRAEFLDALSESGVTASQETLEDLNEVFQRG